MRIGMMADTYKPHISGITNYIELNKRYLEQAGHDVFVFTFGNEGYPDDEPHIIRSPGFPLVNTGYYLSFQHSRRAKQLLQTMDVVHVHHPFISGRLALRYCRPLNVPIIFTNHTRYDIYAQTYLPGIPPEISDSLLETYMPEFCAAVDMVISPSPGMAGVLRRFKVNAPITIVPNGVELNRFYKSDGRAQRERYGLRADDLLLVYTGRLAPEKNLPFLFKAFCGLREALPNVQLLLVGDGPERKTLEEQALDSGYGDSIHFAGRVSYAELPNYLSMCDVFVTASVSEVHPLSVIEAMAAGLPVMGIDSVGVGDIVKDGVSGYLSSEDLAAFTAKLTRLCLDESARRRMGQQARKESQRYDIQRTTEEMLKHYERLSREGHSRQRGVGFRLRSFLEKFR
ncbi:MAG: glycosyltransferase family 4 protein [Anaerolineales bacterium]